MARMIPNTLLRGEISPAELLVFETLRKNLDDDYTTIHSVDLYSRLNPGGRLHSGESDFIIVHPERGFIVIEVKGGEIERNSITNQWFSIDSRGDVHPIKDPYRQSKDNAFALKSQMESCKNLEKYTFPFGHAVWFPDVAIEGRNFDLPSALKEITLDNHAVNYTDRSIRKLFTNVLGEKRIHTVGKQGVDELVNFLAPSWKFSMDMSWRLQQGEEKILEATKSQFKVLSFTNSFKRALVSGPAGSGKTMIILEKANRIARQDTNNKVLILCFNKNLASALKRAVGYQCNIDVYNFHNFCEVQANEAGIKIKEFVSSEARDYFDNYFPELLSQALECSGTRYDCILVDEGQDFQSHWWIPIEEALADNEESTFFIFFDDNQKIYTDKHDFPIELPPFQLEENCRNTRLIHEEAMHYYQAKVEPKAIGPEGVAPTIVEVKNHLTEKEKLEVLLQKFVSKEKIDPSNITILTPKKREKSQWKTNEMVGGCSLYWNESEKKSAKSIQVSTIHAFKGLENSIIIVTELDGIQGWMRNELMYIATSRAKMYLIIFNCKENSGE